MSRSATAKPNYRDDDEDEGELEPWEMLAKQHTKKSFRAPTLSKTLEKMNRGEQHFSGSQGSRQQQAASGKPQAKKSPHPPGFSQSLLARKPSAAGSSKRSLAVAAKEEDESDESSDDCEFNFKI